MQLVFDFETNGLLDRPDLKILCLVVQDVETEEVWRFADICHQAKWDLTGTLDDGVDHLGRADLLIGHNIVGFDIPLADRFFPGWRPNTLGPWFDTKLVGQQVWTGEQIIKMSAIFRNRIGGRSEKKREEAYPRRLLRMKGAHTLEAWGYRLQMKKGEFLKDMGVQEECSKELIDYCERDVRVNRALFLRQRSHGIYPNEPAMPLEAAICESQFGYLMWLQENTGVGFNEKEANALYSELCEKRHALEKDLRENFFPDWWAPKKVNGDFSEEIKAHQDPSKPDGFYAAYVLPKRTYRVPYPHNLAGREAGCAFTPIELKQFNAKADTVDRLINVYGWKPKEFTENTGEPKLDDKILSDLDYPCVPKVRELLMVSKRIGQLAEGRKAWLKFVKDGKIHGRIHPSGTRTSRCSHSDPNLGQVPTVDKPYGKECRALFRPTVKKWVLVGTDASGIELRMLGHRMAFYDSGQMAEVILHGDIHENWRQLTGLFFRGTQKNVSYSYLYGGGGKVIGMYALMDWRRAYAEGVTEKEPPSNEYAESLGNTIKAALTERTPGLQDLVDACHNSFKRKWLRGIDGRVIRVVSEHGSVNDLLQSDAGITMKHAAVIRWNLLVERGWKYGEDFLLHLNVHDEWQDGVPPEKADEFGTISVEAMRLAGEHLKLRIPLDGEFKIGENWCETH